MYDASLRWRHSSRGPPSAPNLHRPKCNASPENVTFRATGESTSRDADISPRQVPCRTGRYPQGAQLPRNIGFGAGNAHLVQRPVDRSVGRRQLDRRDRHLLSGSYLHQGQILDRDQGERQIRLQPHQGDAVPAADGRRERQQDHGQRRRMVQESGRVRHLGEPGVRTARRTGLTAQFCNSAASSPTVTNRAPSRRRSTSRARS